MGDIVGVVLAAGRGRRMGGPKALLRTPGGQPYLERACAALTGGGCARVVVVLGAGAEEAAALAPPGARVVVNDAWEEGMSTSLRMGLEHGGAAALVHLVDLPDVGEAVVRRILTRARDQGPLERALARALYAGGPGHPVLIGAGHYEGVRHSLAGDAGARGYLAATPHTLVDVADLATGRDIDTPEDLREFGRGPGEEPPTPSTP